MDFKNGWPRATQENSKRYYLHINAERAGRFIAGHDEASCCAEARHRRAGFPDLWRFREVWRWLERVDSEREVGKEGSSLGYESGVKGLEDKEEEMKKGAERLARRRTKAEGVARRRGEGGGAYFSVFKQQAELVESKSACGGEELGRGGEQGLEESRDVEGRGRGVLPQAHDTVAASALTSSKWMNSNIGGGSSGILTPAGYYNKWGRQTGISKALAGYSFPGMAG